LDPVNGAPLWSTELSLAGAGTGVAVDSLFNVYVVGARNVITSNTPSEIFAKLDPTGNVLWEHTSEKHALNDVVVDASDNVFVARTEYSLWMSGTLVEWNAQLGQIDTSGVLTAVTTLRSRSNFLGGQQVRALALALDTGGTAYLAGSSVGQLTNSTIPNDPGGGFVVRLPQPN
jgi:hypothetical protein